MSLPGVDLSGSTISPQESQTSSFKGGNAQGGSSGTGGTGNVVFGNVGAHSNTSTIVIYVVIGVVVIGVAWFLLKR